MRTTATSTILAAATMFAAMAATPAAGLSDAEVNDLVRRSYQYVAMYKAETGKIQGEIDSARAQAKGITENAARTAGQVKADLELQKAALEAEKARTQAAQQEIDQDKLKVEVERKRIEEEKKALEEARKKAEEAQKRAVEPPPAPPAEPPSGATSR